MILDDLEEMLAEEQPISVIETLAQTFSTIKNLTQENLAEERMIVHSAHFQKLQQEVSLIKTLCLQDSEASVDENNDALDLVEKIKDEISQINDNYKNIRQLIALLDQLKSELIKF